MLLALVLAGGVALWVSMRNRTATREEDLTNRGSSVAEHRNRDRHSEGRPGTKSESRLSPEELRGLIARLMDSRQSLAARQAAARELARDGSPDALEALKSALRDSPHELKVCVAEALGDCPSPEALSILVSLISGDDEATARAALRGLAKRGDESSIEALSSVLMDEGRSVELRTEAALSLGGVDKPGSLAALARGLREIRDETVLEHILDGLGHQPFSAVESLFRDFLKRDDLSTESRIAAIEALGNSSDQATAFLLAFASDADAEVRAAAGWALVSSSDPGDIRSQLTSWMAREDDATVRLRLYQALARQDDVGSSTILPIVQRETDPEARLAALGLLAATIRSDKGDEAGKYFDTTAVGELKSVALGSGRLDQSLGAIMALERAGTAGSIAVLREISQGPSDEKLRAAALQALKRRKAE